MTKIEWTDESWNPVTGCTKCSPGCENCYAERMAPRLQKMSPQKYRNGFGVTLHLEELKKPLSWKKPRKIFLCSMGDLFHKNVPSEFIIQVMHTIAQTPWHTYQILTKRPERMLFFSRSSFLPSNIWAGVTIENRDVLEERLIPLTRITGVDVRFVSCEPLLEFINFDLSQIDWLICGGETGPNARPMNPDWARHLRDQCKLYDIPFFFKQMSSKQPIPDDLQIREFPHEFLQKKGKQ